MAEHHLKSWPNLFTLLLTGEKVHDLRRTDRTFAIGDEVWLHEFDPTTNNYTGASVMFPITYITSADQPCALSDEGLKPGFCILSYGCVPQE